MASSNFRIKNGLTVGNSVFTVDIASNNPSLILANNATITAGGVAGTNGQVLTSNGSGVYWAAATGGGGSGNVDLSAQYTWTNTHTFTANLIVNTTITIGGTTINSTSYSGSANNANNLSGVSLYTIQNQITGNAATAYSNAVADAASNAATIYQTTAGLSANVLKLAANSATYLGNSSGTIANVSSWITGNAATAYANATGYSDSKADAAYANAVANAAALYQTTAGLAANVATLTSNATTYLGNNTGTLANVASWITGNAATAYTNATSYSSDKAANAYANAVANAAAIYQTMTGLSANVATLAANSATYLGNSSGTVANIASWITGNAATAYTNATSYGDNTYAKLSGATFTGAVLVSNNLTVSGNLIVNGTTVTINATTLDVRDNNITVAKGTASNATADGAGLTVDTVNAQIYYNYSSNSWQQNLSLTPSTNNALNLGSTTLVWNTIYVSNVVANNISGNGANITSVNANTLGSVSITTIQNQITGNAATAYSNAVANAAALYQTTAGLSANVLTLTSNATTYLGNSATTGANVASWITGNAATAYTNATSYSSDKAANAYANAVANAAAIYQTMSGLSANVATLASNSTSYLGNTSGTLSNIVSWISGNSSDYAANAYANSVAYTLALLYVSNVAIYQTVAGLSANVLTLTSNATTYLGNTSGTLANVSSWITGNAATAYTNATSYSSDKAANAYANAVANAAALYQTMSGLSANVLTLTSNATTYLGNTSGTLANIASWITGNSATAYTNATSYSSDKAANAYANAIAYSSNASNLSSGTIAAARLGSGTANSTTVLYGNNVWAVPTRSAVVKQQFTANGSTSTFTVSGGYTSGTLTVYVNGVKQLDTVDVAATDGSTVVFTTTPPNNAVVDVFGFYSSSLVGLAGVNTSSQYTWSNTQIFTANINMSNTYINSSVLKGYSEYITVNTAVSGTTTLDLSTTNFFNLTLVGNTTFVFTNPPANSAYTFTIVAKQDATGGRSITWPTSKKYDSGVTPPPTTNANAIDIWTLLTYDAGTSYIVSLSVKDAK